MTQQAPSPDIQRMHLEILMQIARNNESALKSNEFIMQTLMKTQLNQQTPDKIADVLTIIGDNNVLSQAKNSVITINPQQLQGLTPDLNQAIQSFTLGVNKEIQKRNISAEEITQIRDSVLDLGKETEGVEPGKLKGVKRAGIKAKLMQVGENLCRNLPRTAETIALFTPLAPYAHLIGETIEQLMQEVQAEC